jgi:hypothetical protein
MESSATGWGSILSSWLIAVVGVVYLYIGIEQYFKGNSPLAIAFIGYSFSNWGLYLAAK